MAKGGGSAPPSPDYASLIPQQTAANMQMFDYALNRSRTNQVNPYGSSIWSQGGPSYSYGLPNMSPPNAGIQPVRARAQSAADVAAGYGIASQPSGNSEAPWTNIVTLSPTQQLLFDNANAAQYAQGQAQLTQSQLAQALSQQLGSQGLGSPLNTGSFSQWGSVDPGQAGASYTPTGLDVGGPLTQDRSTTNYAALQALMDRIEAMDPNRFNQQAADSVYNSSSRYLDTQYGTDLRNMESRLAEQGFVPGTPAYQQQLDTFRQAKERAYADARDRANAMGAQIGGNQYNSRLNAIAQEMGLVGQGANYGLANDQARVAEAAGLFGQNLQRNTALRQSTLDSNDVANQLFSRQLAAGQMGNNTRQQQLAEALALRGLPLNELNALRTGGAFQMPNFGAGQSGVPGLSSPDQLGAAMQNYQNQVGMYNSNQASANATNSSLAGLGSSALMAWFM